MDRIFVYTRISTEKQVEKETQKNQEFEIQHFLQDKAIQVIQEFQDLAKSGSNLKRPQMLEMIDRLDEVDGICVYDWDRLTRDEEFGVMLMYKMKKLQKKVYEVRTQNILKFEEMSERMLIVMKSMIAEEERKKIKARQKIGIERYIREKGRWGPKLKKINWKKFQEYLDLGLPKTNIAKLFGMSTRTLNRRIKEKTLAEESNATVS